MRKAPNYVLGEAVDGIWKRELLVYLGQEFNLKTLIETGTCDGGTFFLSIIIIYLKEFLNHIRILNCI